MATACDAVTMVAAAEAGSYFSPSCGKKKKTTQGNEKQEHRSIHEAWPAGLTVCFFKT